MENPVMWSTSLFVRAMRRPWRLSIAGSVFLLSLWAIVSTPYLFEDQTVRWVSLVYFAFIAFGLWAAERHPLRDTNVVQGWSWFAMAFIITYLITLTALGGLGGGSYNGSFTGLVLLQSMLVAMGENLLFFGALPAWLTPGQTGRVDDNMLIVSAVVFGLFHGWAYQWNWLSMVVAMAFALLMFWIIYTVRRRTGSYGAGLMASIGAHAGYNVAVYAAMSLTLMKVGQMALMEVLV